MAIIFISKKIFNNIILPLFIIFINFNLVKLKLININNILLLISYNIVITRPII